MIRSGVTYSVTSIGDNAFESSGLTSVTIPNSVTSIADYAFSSCSGLTSISIPSSVKSIGSWTFYNCSGLTSVTIPNSVTSIADYAFYNCTALTTLNIPSNITSIADYAFASCSALKSVTVNWQTPLTINTTVFEGSSASTAVLNVPAGKQAAYGAANTWKSFSKICALPFAPTAQAQLFCGAATVANLVATGTSLKWYKAASGGTPLPSTTNLSTGNYFVTQTGGDCGRESARTQVAVTVNPLPTAPTAIAQSFCGVAKVLNLVSTGGTGIKWYNVATGGTPLLDTVALSTGNYFVSQTEGTCESTRTQVAVTVNPLPTAPTANAQSFCGSTTVAKLLPAPSTSIKWYNVATGGTALISTTAITSSASYYVATVSATGCESSRKLVAITINARPSTPVASPQSFCGSATIANLVATGTSLKWYNAASGGTPLLSTTNLITGNYYVSQSSTTCESSRRLVAVTVNTLPNAPTANSNQTFLQGATVAKLLPTPSSTIKWYNVATGSTPIDSITVLSTGNYFVSQTNNLCESARTLVAITVNQIPSAPIANAQSFCGSATVANLVATGTSLKWYNVATAGTPLLSTTSLITGNYYVSQTIGAIESARTLVTVTMNTAPSAPIASTQSFNGSATVANLVATGSSLKWYNVATAGAPLLSTTNLITGNYYVTQTVGTCESARTLVVVTMNTAPNAPIASAQSFNGSATVANLVATGTSLKWYNVANAGTPLLSTTSLITGNYYVSQTVGAIESSRTLVPVTVAQSTAPIISFVFNSGATVSNLSAIGSNLKWYNVATAGTPLLSTTSLITGNYYVSQTVGTCESAKTMVSVIINTAPIASAQSFCGSATVASLVATGTSLKWYNVATAGTPLLSTTSLITGNYYVSQTVGSLESNRTLVVVTMNTAPSAPVASAQSFNSSATVANLVATGSSLKWYNVATGGTPLLSTTSLITGNYYVSQTVGTCESVRTLVAVSINIVPSAPLVTSFTPTTAATGATVTITGTNFTGATAVSFGGTAASSFTVVNATTITAVVGGGTSGNVSVTTPGGTATKAGFVFNSVPTNGLIAWYPFNGNTLDNSGNNYHGVNTGATLTTDRFGKANSAYNFSGSGQYITCPNIPTLNGLTNATFSLWVKVNGKNAWDNGTDVDNAMFILSRDRDIAPGYIGMNFSPNTQTFASGFRNGTGVGLGSTVKYPVPQPIWHHLSFTLGGGFFKFYVDGSLVNSTPFTAPLATSSGAINLGKLPVGGYEYYLNGLLDDVAIYGRTLTGTEIKALYDLNGYAAPTLTSFAPKTELYVEKQISIYPNPVTNGVLNVVAGNDDIKSITIMNLNGIKVLTISKVSDPKKVTINTNHLVKGAYLLEIKEVAKTSIHKIIIN